MFEAIQPANWRVNYRFLLEFWWLRVNREHTIALGLFAPLEQQKERIESHMRGEAYAVSPVKNANYETYFFTMAAFGAEISRGRLAENCTLCVTEFA